MLLSLSEAGAALGTLAIFRGLLKDPVIAKFQELALSRGAPKEKAALCAAFVSELYQHTEDFSGYLLDRVLADENAYVLRLARMRGEAGPMEQCMLQELKLFQNISRLTVEEVRSQIGWEGFLPGWINGPYDFAKAYQDQMDHISQRGYGVFAKHHMFTVKDGVLMPVQFPETVRLSDLTGYEREREQAVRNAEALLKGKPAANVLLYGDAGTGKSTCVKAIVNEFYSRGLRLIELRKDQLFRIPELMGRLSQNPLKFILFIDDLSFSKNDGNFSALKAMLEGSVAAKSPNIAIYATSNRRHLVLERFSDREGDEIHLNDTMQELSSLSDRFGLVITFVRPDKDLYLDVVKSYLRVYGIPCTSDLCTQAEAYALKRGGRSPRVARHFAESLASQA